MTKEEKSEDYDRLQYEFTQISQDLKSEKRKNKALNKELILSGVINWVATNKKLPKQTGDILIYVDGLGVRNAIFNITDNSFSFNSVYKPTHWAELPKPPCL
jgi:hypothetical protein